MEREAGGAVQSVGCKREGAWGALEVMPRLKGNPRTGIGWAEAQGSARDTAWGTVEQVSARWAVQQGEAQILMRGEAGVKATERRTAQQVGRYTQRAWWSTQGSAMGMQGGRESDVWCQGSSTRGGVTQGQFPGLRDDT